MAASEQRVIWRGVRPTLFTHFRHPLGLPGLDEFDRAPPETKRLFERLDLRELCQACVYAEDFHEVLLERDPETESLWRDIGAVTGCVVRLKGAVEARDQDALRFVVAFRNFHFVEESEFYEELCEKNRELERLERFNDRIAWLRHLGKPGEALFRFFRAFAPLPPYRTPAMEEGVYLADHHWDDCANALGSMIEELERMARDGGKQVVLTMS